MRTGWYALALVLGAPFLAESVASANTPAVLFPVLLPFYAVVYGLPALLLRELLVRGRLTAPGLLAYGIGYTAFNEGVVAATWFKLEPGTGGVLSFTAEQAGHWAGVNWPVALNLVVFHTVYSLVVPITLVQALADRRGSGAEQRPWVRRRGAVWCTVPVVVVLLGSLTPQATAETCAGPALTTCAVGRWSAAALVVLVGIGAAVAAKRAVTTVPGRPAVVTTRGHGPARPGPSAASLRPTRRVLAGAGFGIAFFLTFFALPLSGRPAAALVAGLGLLGVVLVGTTRWCRRPAADPRADVLVVTGALLPGMLASFNFWQVGQPVAVLLAVGLLWYLLRRPRPVEWVTRRPAGAGNA